MDTQDNTDLRVPSFSSYLQTSKDHLVQRISVKDSINPPFGIRTPDTLTNLRVDSFAHPKVSGENFAFNITRPDKGNPSPLIDMEKNKYMEGEIGVFRADKYLNVKMEYGMGVKLDYKDQEPVSLPLAGSNFRSGTTSVYSEGSSLNSQTALLQNLERVAPQRKPKRSLGMRIFANLGCQGPCLERKAIHVDESVSSGAFYGSKPTRKESNQVDLLAFQISNPGTHTFPVKDKFEEEKPDEPRRSLEVFGCGNSTKGSIAKHLERKLSMLTWDAIPKLGQNPPASTVGTSTICDDMASDASSDLFEIENISGKVYPMLSADQEPDNMSCCMSPTIQYAPSEASIDWSVVTASAAGYSSVISDYDEKSVSTTFGKHRPSKGANDGGKRAPKTRSGGLLGCTNHKAVNVVERV